MRTSCNGCRVLRKACNEDCAIRPSIEWIPLPEHQANATVFLAKFYGRAGLLNLITTALPNHRAAVFKSLLYEACGRIVDPVQGSVGLMWSGQWHHCQAAVDAVLKGNPVMQIPNPPEVGPAFEGGPLSPTAALGMYDIRHVYSSSRKARVRALGPGMVIEEPDHDGSMFSNETVEHAVVNRIVMNRGQGKGEPGLELTLGLGMC